MADNYVANVGSGGSTFASDDVSSVQYPRLKRSFGRDAVASDAGSSFRLNSAASNNATSVKASAGTLYSLFAVNLNAAVRYVKFYNKASAPAPATDNSLLLAVFPIPASTTGAGFSINLDPGIDFSTGIAYAVVTDASDTGNTSVAANEIFLVGVYV
jgi:hypothetical protein